MEKTHCDYDENITNYLEKQNEHLAFLDHQQIISLCMHLLFNVNVQNLDISISPLALPLPLSFYLI